MTDKHTNETAAPDTVFGLLAAPLENGAGQRMGIRRYVVGRWFGEKRGPNIEHPADRTETEFYEWTPAQLVVYRSADSRERLPATPSSAGGIPPGGRRS